MMEPRKPTSEEKQELANLLISEAGYEQEEIAQIIDSSAVASLMTTLPVDQDIAAK